MVETYGKDSSVIKYINYIIVNKKMFYMSIKHFFPCSPISGFRSLDGDLIIFSLIFFLELYYRTSFRNL